MYSPILRKRQSEMLGFRHLSSSVRQHLMPLLDVAAPTKSDDQAAALQYVARNIARTEQSMTGVPAVLVDSSELRPDFRLQNDTHPLSSAAAAIERAGSRPVPVMGLHRDATHNDAAIAI